MSNVNSIIKMSTSLKALEDNIMMLIQLNFDVKISSELLNNNRIQLNIKTLKKNEYTVIFHVSGFCAIDCWKNGTHIWHYDNNEEDFLEIYAEFLKKLENELNEF